MGVCVKTGYVIRVRMVLFCFTEQRLSEGLQLVALCEHEGRMFLMPVTCRGPG